MKEALFITLLLAATVTATAQQAGLQADPNPAAQADIKALQLKLVHWILRGDWDEYERHLSADYLRTDYNGHVEDKDEALATLRDGHRKIIVMELEPADQRVHLYGGTAVSNAEFTISVRESGQLKTHRIRLTTVFVKRDGEWYLIAEQGTVLGK